MSLQPRTIGVLIASYQRPKELLRCLTALERQLHKPDQVILVVRLSDSKTLEALEMYKRDSLPILQLAITEPGLVAARNSGMAACETDILAMLDDDTVPHPDWLQRIFIDFLEDDSLGGLGGRDRCFINGAFDERKKDVVGKLQWFGRQIGNNHLGFGPIREVDLLKGANMSYRAAALTRAQCDIRLKGLGAEASEDVSLCLAVKRQGWKLAYDPAAVVDHYSQRGDQHQLPSDAISVRDQQRLGDFAYNEVISIWESLRFTGRCAFVVWSFLIGTRSCPGLAQAIRFAPALGGRSWTHFMACQRGKLQAMLDVLGV